MSQPKRHRRAGCPTSRKSTRTGSSRSPLTVLAPSARYRRRPENRLPASSPTPKPRTAALTTATGPSRTPGRGHLPSQCPPDHEGDPRQNCSVAAAVRELVEKHFGRGDGAEQVDLDQAPVVLALLAAELAEQHDPGVVDQHTRCASTATRWPSAARPRAVVPPMPDNAAVTDAVEVASARSTTSICPLTVSSVVGRAFTVRAAKS